MNKQNEENKQEEEIKKIDKERRRQAGRWNKE